MRKRVALSFPLNQATKNISTSTHSETEINLNRIATTSELREMKLTTSVYALALFSYSGAVQAQVQDFFSCTSDKPVGACCSEFDGDGLAYNCMTPFGSV